MSLYAILIYNAILIEFLLMAALAWRYNGLATRGTGRFFGPFALMAAMVLISGDIRRLGVDLPIWFLLLVWTALGITGLRVVIHMGLQVYELRKNGDLGTREREY